MRVGWIHASNEEVMRGLALNGTTIGGGTICQFASGQCHIAYTYLYASQHWSACDPFVWRLPHVVLCHCIGIVVGVLRSGLLEGYIAVLRTTFEKRCGAIVAAISKYLPEAKFVRPEVRVCSFVAVCHCVVFCIV